jgi:hypothetical protein
VSNLRQELRELQMQSANLHRQVQAFMPDHKMAVAALVAGAAGAGAALDDGGRFTQSAREVGAFVGVLVVGWALFNCEEVAQGAFELAQAESAAQALAAREARTREALDGATGDLSAARSRHQLASDEAGRLRAALESL